MAQVIHHEHEYTPRENGAGFYLGLVILILAFLMVVFYGLPYLMNNRGTANPQINVPGKIDINVQKGTK